MKLDIACGHKRQDGYLGVDIVAMPGVDIVCDLEAFPWPFDDSSVEAVYCSHYVEHTPDLIKFMDELYRICKPGATVTLIHPYYTSIGAWQDPTHKRALSEKSWLYFSSEWRKQMKLDHYPIRANFSVRNVKFAFHPGYDNKPLDELQNAITHYWNVVSELWMELDAIK